MTYSFKIDQEFAIVNNLSLTQVSTLAAFMTLPIWTKTVAIDGYVWYKYTDEKMAEDFPLLFGVPKRCYKNITELSELGFVELTKLGREKYIRFTKRCADWDKPKEQNRSESPKTDFSQSENGLKEGENSPKTDFSNNNNSNINNSIIRDNNLFPEQGIVITSPAKKRGGPKPKVSFEETEYNNNPQLFCQRLAETGEFPANVNYMHYYYSAIDWSAKGNKYAEWIAGVRNWIRSDMQNNKLPLIKNGGTALSPDAIEYLQSMAD